jgi:hypothetical protein
MQPTVSPRKSTRTDRGFVKNAARSLSAVFYAALWSQRSRWGQTIPVTFALLLLVGTAQGINALHDVSSTLARRQVAAHWRAPYDLLVRAPGSVSQPERTAGWIDPQSALDSYGGISARQVDQIGALSGVEDVAPYANTGWQSVDIEIPISFNQPGLYRILSQWQDWQTSGIDAITPIYVDVTGLQNLLQEPVISDMLIQYVSWPNKAGVAAYTVLIPAIQELIGVDATQEAQLASLLAQGNRSPDPVHVKLQIEKLRGSMTMLPACVQLVACWMPAQEREGAPFYRPGGVQLLRFTPLQVTAAPSQLAAGQLSIVPLGMNGQQPRYRALLDGNVAGDASLLEGVSLSAQVVPLSEPEQSPLLPSAMRFIPLSVACSINGAQCYNGVYVRLHGVESYSQRSLAALQAVAAQITKRTGLHVDILDGSSTRSVVIGSGANGSFVASWQVVGVAVQIVHGVDTLQETLLVLCAVICFLTAGAAGVLVGIGRRDETRLLAQLGWPPVQRALALLISALMLLLPGGLLASICIICLARFWPGSLPALLVFGLLVCGMLVFGAALICIGMSREQGARKKGRPHLPFALPSFGSIGTAFHAKILAPATCAITIALTSFLIAIEYMLLTSFNHELFVTVLGSQVGTSLEIPQLLLSLLLLLSALMSIGLCVVLLLRSRRGEIVLLAQVGWERRDVLARLLREMAMAAALSGEIGVLLALFAVGLTGAPPSVGTIAAMIAGGPLLGLLLSCPLTGGLIWRELESVTLWR